MIIPSHSVAKMKFVNGNSWPWTNITVNQTYEIVAWLYDAGSIRGLFLDDNDHLFAPDVSSTFDWQIIAI